MNNSKLPKFLPWIAAGVTALYFGFFMLPRSEGAKDFHFREFGKLPALDDGRVKPINTVAESSLLIITQRRSYYDHKNGERHSANKWLLDVMTSPASGDPLMGQIAPEHRQNPPSWDFRVFRIDSEELVRLLGLKWREGHSYSINEINENEKLAYLEEETARIEKIAVKDRNLLDSKIAELASNLRTCMALSMLHTPRLVPAPEKDAPWVSFRSAVSEVFRLHGKQLGARMAEGATFRAAMLEVLRAPQNGEPVPPELADTVTFYFDLLQSYDAGDVDAFNEKLDKQLARLDAQSPALMSRMRTEVFFNEFAPFYWCCVIYVFIALLGASSWLIPTWSEPIRKSAYAAMGVAFVVQFSGLILRMYLQDRWFVFVTNLYSSAVFIGVGCVAICLIAEYFYRNGISIVVGSATGFATLVIAHLLGLDGDTMIVMPAVLDTNFWLATHVTCVTLGYTTAFVAGFMGIAYIFLGIFTNMLRGETASNLSRATYGVLCTGMFLSFVGTVLGGLWADYSWGRFWGWDPKENGALLIVIWIALILHARWGGMVKGRGIAVLSVLGIIITAWSWFGTNFLGVGLHAYGGAKANAMLALIMIDLAFLAIAGLGLLPLESWHSFRSLPTPETPAKPGARAKAMV